MQNSCRERRIVFKAPLPVDWVSEPNEWVWWSGSGAMRGGGEDRHRDEKEAASSSGLGQE